jgi:DNA-binding transcriptional MocR family regulator
MPPTALSSTLEDRFAAACDRGLDFDLTRGKPSAEQLDLSSPLLEAVGPDDYLSADGIDCRNYGGLEGLPEVRALYAQYLGVQADEILIGDNASLSLMHDVISQALLRGVPGGAGPWSGQSVRFLCPTPGYDRHFSICEYLGIEMIAIDMKNDGPDLDAIERMVEDDTVKGLFCVPRYSNPTGITYSSEVVRRLAAMNTAAPDFRIIWDNAYAVHHLYPDPEPLADILEECKRSGHPNRPLLIGSTSKITLAGSGLSMIAASAENLADLKLFRSRQTIGPDKINLLRHIRFLPDLAAIEAHMRRHAEILRPKFELVQSILDEELSTWNLVTWTRPRGGYFISLDSPPGCAREIIGLAAEAGVRLTPAGATFPLGHDPQDRNIRLAPSFPPLDELREATRILTLAILLVCERKGLLQSVGRSGGREN